MKGIYFNELWKSDRRSRQITNSVKIFESDEVEFLLCVFGVLGSLIHFAWSLLARFMLRFDYRKLLPHQ